ncbi:MAG: AAA family ATPase [Acidimicrobiales bacterium]
MIRRLTLQNWRAYEHLQLEFHPGATFVVAPNGVGKSSIVEGARFALFGLVPPAKGGASRITRSGSTSASVEVDLPSGRRLTVTRPYPTKPRSSSTPDVLLDGEASPAGDLDALLAEEYGAETTFLARLAMLHSSTVFTETKGLDLREHLCRVFGVDGLVAALDQTKLLAQAAKKTVDSARKVATVPEEELAALLELEARAAELTEAAGMERATAEQELANARAAGELRLRYDRWKATSDRYQAVVNDVAAEATTLLGREVSVAALAADLETAEATAVEALDLVRQRRAEVAGHMLAIRAGVAELESAEGTCPVCRRPLGPGDVDAARAGHEQELAALEADLALLDEAEPLGLVEGVRQLRSRLANEPRPGEPPPQPDDEQSPAAESEAVQQFEAAVATAAERRAILTEARRRREAAESARVELEAVTTAFERAAALEAAASALEAARQRILDESIEPLEDLLAENWRKLFVDRPGVGLQGDGTVSRRIGSEDLEYEHFSDGEKMVAQLILRVLVLRATTRLGFFWVDEPLEHLDPDVRRALAVLLAQAPEAPSFRQVLVTTYEEPLIRRLRASVPNTHLIYVRPSAPDPLPTGT